MAASTRLRLHLFAFLLALLGGLACDVILPATTSPAGAAASAASAAACPELVNGKAIAARFTADADLNADIAAFVQASSDVRRLAERSTAAVREACVAMGRDLGVPAEQLQPRDGDGVSPPCSAVAAKIDSILSGSAKLEVRYQPPRCQMDARFKASCEAECGLEVDPGKVVATCEPAQLSGYCQGTCGGRCDGTCTGECEGKCDARDAQGRCVGSCRGTCRGSCDATCYARCEGTWKAPRCEVEVERSQVRAECAANCEASAKVRASCQSPKLEVRSSARAEALNTLAATLRTHLPALIQAQLRLSKQLGRELKVIVDTGARLKGSVGSAGGKAIACVSAAVTALAQASVSINVSVKASASVSTAAGARASSG